MTVAIRTSPQILKSLQNDTLQNVSLHNLIQNHSLSYFKIFNGLLSLFMSIKSSETLHTCLELLNNSFRVFLAESKLENLDP